MTYGDKTFTWTSGRNLESITDGENEYSYTYDENGIRTSKTVNGVTTYYTTKDGVILSQTDGTDTMYFQYDPNGTPLGFTYNGSQYLHMTNQMGDVIAITDTIGNIMASYIYDEWGNVKNIIKADSRIEEQLRLAKANPIRYRGYYCDAETGYYYLQSRYYDPSICRFINVDIPQIAKDNSIGLNLFTYCNDNPINNSDPSGMLAGILTASSIGAILLALVAAIGITWALSTIISRIDYSFVADMLNSLSSTYKLKYAVIKTLVVTSIRSAYSYAKRIAKTTAKAVSTAISIAVADAKVKTIVKNDRRYDYWVAYMSHGVLILGSRLSNNSAISRIRKGLNVMSRNQSYAKSAAYIAGGNRKPKGPEKHGSLGQGYYWHYHIYKHSSNSHVFYI
ncbi:MAG: RHS repeat-associated core domain-containing protein [Acetobacter sp.]|nr:RHS repeat-associated core domain-containing protein [Acetobacter sp.]